MHGALKTLTADGSNPSSNVFFNLSAPASSHDKESHTPFLDSLIDSGVYFSNTFSPADGTITSLNCMFNSKFQYETGIRAKKIILLENNHLQKLKELNYYTVGLIPKLTELLELASRKENKDVFLNLEVKSTPFKIGLTPAPSDTVSLILKNIDTYKLEDRIVISSFDWRILYELKKQNPRILRGFITLQQDLSTTKKNIYENSPWMAKNYSMEELFLLPNIIKSLEGHAWNVFYRDVTKQNVELAHKHGLATCVWTVNREQDIIRMIEYGVDGIITDYPKKVQEICKSKNISWF